jgi:hypothetical protein
MIRKSQRERAPVAFRGPNREERSLLSTTDSVAQPKAAS